MYVALGWHAGEKVRSNPDWQRVSGWRAETVRKPGLEPATLIDVGAASGTPALYRAFPGSYKVLIEPLIEFTPEEPIEHGEFISTAVGDEVGTATIEVGQQSLEHSTIARWRGTTSPDERTVPVTTLDVLREERDWQPPFGLKVDAEGYEHRVIKGASGLLADTQFVIAEIQVANRFQDGYSVSDFIGLMDSHGFVLHDILDGHKGEENGGLHFFDGLFVRR